VGQIPSIAKGFHDGVKLGKLLRQISGEEVKKMNPAPKITAVKLDNITKCLIFCDKHGVDVRGYSPASE